MIKSHDMNKSMRRAASWIIGGLAAFTLWVSAITPAQAELRLCNMTTSRIGVSVGYKNKNAWRTEGWWNLRPNSCETLLPGALSSRYFYIHAQDYDRGGEWGGATPMCTQSKEFTIEGTEDCKERGFDKSKFFEVDTGEQKSWTVQLVDPGKSPAKLP